jgi:hypothetical protein
MTRWRVCKALNHGKRGWLVHARSPEVTESRWCETEAEARALKAALDRGLTIDEAHHAWGVKDD